MKNLISKILTLSGLAIFLLSSCKKDGTIQTVNVSGVTAPTLSASTTNPALVKSNLAATAVTFTATLADYHQSVVSADSLQYDLHSNNFSKATTIAIPASYTVYDLNQLFLKLGATFGNSAQLDFRVRASLSPNAGFVYSNVITLTATPFNIVSYIYVPGAYQGWNPSAADSLQSATSNNIYQGIINFVGSDFNFKITPAKSWNISYGDAGGGKISTSGGNISAPGNGRYFVKVDLNANTITLTKADYYSIIGTSAIDWGTDVDMTFNNGLQLWTLTTALNATSGNGYKIRKNHDWGTSYGFPTSAQSTTLTSASGNNMFVSVAGTYFLTFGVNPADATQAAFTATKQ